MGYINIRATLKWWDPHNKKLKYFSSETFNENENKFDKVWSTGFELMPSKNTSTLKTSKINLSDHPFIKDDIFKANVNFPPGDNPI